MVSVEWSIPAVSAYTSGLHAAYAIGDYTGVSYAKCPYVDGTTDSDQWLTGYSDGCSDINEQDAKKDGG